MLFDRQRHAVEECGRIVHRVLARRHRHLREIGALAAVLVHVALRVHRHPRSRRQQPERHVPRPVDRVGRDERFRDARRVAAPRALVEGAVDDDAFRNARRDRHHRLLDHANRRTAAVRGPTEERQIADADGARDLDLVVGVHGKSSHAVDFGRVDAGVGECGLHRFRRELQLRATRVLRELGLPDPDDRSLILQRDRHQLFLGNERRTVPVT